MTPFAGAELGAAIATPLSDITRILIATKELRRLNIGILLITYK
jgi:hypothetical protein